MACSLSAKIFHRVQMQLLKCQPIDVPYKKPPPGSVQVDHRAAHRFVCSFFRSPRGIYKAHQFQFSNRRTSKDGEYTRLRLTQIAQTVLKSSNTQRIRRVNVLTQPLKSQKQISKSELKVHESPKDLTVRKVGNTSTREGLAEEHQSFGETRWVEE